MPFNKFRHVNSESGQVLLVVVLVAVISLTVGLAAVSRSITNNRVSTEESSSQKALSAAEAGLEEQINRANKGIATDGNIWPGDLDTVSGTGYKATLKKVQGKDVVFNEDKIKVSRSEGVDVWLSNYPDFTTPIADSTLTIFWKKGNECSTSSIATPALEIVVLRGASADPGAKNNPILDRYAVDPCGRANGFTERGTSGTFKPFSKYPDSTYDYKFQIGPISFGYIVRIIPIYADAFIGVQSNVDLPAQGFTVESEGTSGETKRKVKVFQSFPTVPLEIFPYNLFNP